MHFLNKLSKCDVSTVARPREDVSANFTKIRYLKKIATKLGRSKRVVFYYKNSNKNSLNCRGLLPVLE